MCEVRPLTEQSCPVQRRPEEVIISCHVTALVRRQHLHHCLVTVGNSEVQGCPTLIVLPVQEGLCGSCLLDTHTHIHTDKTTTLKKKTCRLEGSGWRMMMTDHSYVCVCV